MLVICCTYSEVVASRKAQPGDEIERRAVAAHMYLFGPEAEQGARPRPATLRVLNHLNLVYDGHVEALVQVGHLDRARHMIGRLAVVSGEHS